jgi:RHS repeat-associated protein
MYSLVKSPRGVVPRPLFLSKPPHVARVGVRAYVACLFAVLALACGGREDASANHAPRQAPSALNGTGLQGEYFDNEDLTSLVTTRLDATVDFDWLTSTPAGTALTDGESFSVRWTGQVIAPVTGLYTFTTTSDDGVRLWVDGQLLVDNWTLHSSRDDTGTISLVEGQVYAVRMEYFESVDFAIAQLSWEYPGQDLQIIPTSALRPPATPDAGTVVAPPVSPVLATDFGDATAFLYTGPDALQLGVDAGTMEAKRVAVVRGRVLDRSGAPVSGARVSILAHPELGYTLSRADGGYDLAVNGGALLTVSVEKGGFLSVQRQVQAPWRDYVVVPDVVLTPLDAAVTDVLLGGSGVQVAQGSVSNDVEGPRRATLMFAAGTQATLTLPDGTTAPLAGTIHVRATEYTVGDAGPAAMPGTLPAATGYTYAVELSLDEALAVGATEVTFSQPVYTYVDNFLGFPVGGIVPAGYYDRRQGLWIASDNGRVVAIVGVTAGLAQLDTNGDGLADDAPALAALGFTDAERTQLASLYPVGHSLWRVPITHFTPWDLNWPYGPPEDARAPEMTAPATQTPLENPTCQNGSIIECQNQTLGEVLPVTGTPFTLNYRSDRVPGRKTHSLLKIPLSGASLPSSVRRIVLEVYIAGRVFNHQFSAGPNRSYTFEWDGLDAYGREVRGAQPVLVRVGYVYGLTYQTPAEFARSFAIISGVTSSVVRPAQELTLWQTWQTLLGAARAPLPHVGGWSLSAHHVYDSASSTLFLGDGGRRSAKGLTRIITTVAGGGQNAGAPDDGRPATQADLSHPLAVAVGPDGSFYFSESESSRIRKVGPDGIIQTIAGGGYSSADGVPATQARLGSVWGIAVGPDGSVYLTDRSTCTLRRVLPDGTITTVAGQYGVQGNSGDGGPARLALLKGAHGVALGSDGSVYIVDRDSHVVRRVDPTGIITTVAGTGVQGSSGDGGPAAQAQLSLPEGIAVGPDGSLYIADIANHSIRKVGTDGRITTVAGRGWPAGNSGDGGPARQAGMYFPHGIAVSPDGTLYILDLNHRIRRVTPDGLIANMAGTGYAGFGGDEGPAPAASFAFAEGVALSPDGNLYIADTSNRRIRRLAAYLPGIAAEFIVPSEDGSEVYLFDGRGQHVRTMDALTQATKLTFGYDAEGRLTQVTDADGLVTHVERNTAGRPTAVVAPHGQRTVLGVDAQGYLNSVTNPASEATLLTHGTTGLLTQLEDPRGQQHVFEYDVEGRLTKDSSPGGAQKSLTRTDGTNGDYTVSLTTRLGRTTTYSVQSLATGGQVNTTTSPAGLASTTTELPDGTTTRLAPDGTLVTMVEGPDARFGMASPLTTSETVRVPSGLTSTVTRSQSMVGVDGGTALDFVSLTETVTVNGHAFTSRYESAPRTVTTTSPLGRTATTTLDEKGRVVRVEVPGILPVVPGYDAEGRLSSVIQGTRTSTVSYNDAGYPETVTDALQRTSQSTYDLAGRVISRQLPGQRVVGFGYDPAGNLTALTPPGRPAHVMGYTPNDLENLYTAPSVPDGGTLSTSTAFTLDEEPETMNLPDGTALQVRYTDGGQWASVTTDRTTVTAAYDTAGRLSALMDPQGVSLQYTYDGPLPTSETWDAGVAGVGGSVGYGYDSNLRASSISVNGANPVVYSWDSDGLLSSAGGLTLARNPQNGLLTGTTLGNISTSQSFDVYGHVEGLSASSGSTGLFGETFIRDDLGRITSKTETVLGETHTHGYTYDTAGRLENVFLDGAQVSHYVYDGNGNRTSVTQGGGTVGATYDAQDRVQTYGDTAYVFGPNGDLRQKLMAGSAQPTQYFYDNLGALLAAVLPDGTRVDYVLDARGRRQGKKVNGALLQSFLYDGRSRVVAELDGTGNVVGRFVYGSRSNVPDYMMKGGVVYRLVPDHLGSVRLVVNSQTGVVAQRLDYDVWGNVTADSSPGLQPFGFAGGLYDRHTGLTRFGARDYDAETGRWASKDPIRFDSGGTNLYEYVLSDPINLVDSNGLAPDVAMYEKELDAAKAGFAYIRNKNIDRENNEIAFFVVKEGKKYKYTTPVVVDRKNSSKVCDGGETPEFPTGTYGLCHTHPLRCNPQFSPGDEKASAAPNTSGVTFYLMNGPGELFQMLAGNREQGRTPIPVDWEKVAP